jgi:formate dehydrogenase iron-sulfur subunit
MSIRVPHSPRGEVSVRRPEAERMGFFTDTTVCIGCKACEVACKQWNDLPADGSQFKRGGSYDHTGRLSASTWRHVRFVELDEPSPLTVSEAQDLDLIAVAEARAAETGVQPAVDIAQAVADMSRWIFMSDVCKHCTHAGCMDACPTGALVRTEFETIVVQQDICNGCGYCIPSCPFGVIDRDQGDGRAAKCTLCYDRLQDGLEPACAKACPTDSIQFGTYDELLDVAERRVATLHERGRTEAYIYGAGDAPGEELAGGLGSFFLLTEPPERFGLPAHADSPIQENVVTATAAAVTAGLAAAAGVAVAFGAARRNPGAGARAGGGLVTGAALAIGGLELARDVWRGRRRGGA